MSMWEAFWIRFYMWWRGNKWLKFNYKKNNVNNICVATDWKKQEFHEVTWIVKKQIPLWLAELLLSIIIPACFFLKCKTAITTKKPTQFVYFFCLFFVFFHF